MNQNTIDRAKRDAMRTHRPIYIVDEGVTADRPGKTSAVVWPNGSITWGDPRAAAAQIDRRHLPPREAA